MFDLPLFPLNTVLFPGMPLPLHIFEERYKRMIQLCLENKEPFGVVLIRQGSEAHGPLADPHEIGCTARIIEVKPLTDGRMNIITLGESRFRILSLSYDRPYLVGRVEFYPLAPADPQALALAGRRLLPRVRRYMAILNQVSEVNLDSKSLPEEPLELAYLAAVLLQVPPDQKQVLLDSSMAIEFLHVIEKMYRREVALLRAQLAYEQDKGMGSIPLN